MRMDSTKSVDRFIREDRARRLGSYLDSLEKAESRRDKDADEVLHDIKEDFKWATRLCEEMEMVKPEGDDQIPPEQVFQIFDSINYTLKMVLTLGEMVGCKIRSEGYRWDHELGCQNRIKD